jgi:hypothetical protein
VEKRSGRQEREREEERRRERTPKEGRTKGNVEEKNRE